MIAATNHQQHRNAQCRGGQGPVAATRTAHSPAAFNKHQDRSAFRGRAGFFVRRTLLHGSSSQVTEPGLRARPFSHVGWCFNTARDFLDFQALTRAGIRPDHAVALLASAVASNSGEGDQSLGGRTGGLDMSAGGAGTDADADYDQRDPFEG